jgi:hypothetical protein
MNPCSVASLGSGKQVTAIRETTERGVTQPRTLCGDGQVMARAGRGLVYKIEACDGCLGLAVNSHRFDLFLVAVADGDLGHLGDVCDFALSLLLVTQQ